MALIITPFSLGAVADDPTIKYTIDNLVTTSTSLTIVDEEGIKNAYGYNDTSIDWSTPTHIATGYRGTDAFSPDGDRLVRLDQYDLINSDGWANSFLVRLDTIGAIVQLYATDTTDGDTGEGLAYMDVRSSGSSIVFGFYDLDYTNGFEGSYSTGGLSTGTEYLITVVYDPINNNASDVKVYINASELSLTSSSADGTFNSNMVDWSQVNMTWGGVVQTDRTINTPLVVDGFIDEIMLYNTPLDSSEVTNLLDDLQNPLVEEEEESAVPSQSNNINNMALLMIISLLISAFMVNLNSKFLVAEFKGFTVRTIAVVIPIIIALLIIVVSVLQIII